MLISFLRAGLIYLLLIFAIRLMGKRQIGQMEPSEFVLALLIADLAAVPMQDPAIPLLYGLMPIAVIVCIALLLSVIAYHSIGFRKLLCGKPVILIENGNLLQENFRKTRLTLDELNEHLRENSITDLSTVKYAILETNGQISAVQYAYAQPPTAEDLNISRSDPMLPVTLISNGKLIVPNLGAAGKDKTWLLKQLKQRSATISGTYLFTVDQSDSILFIRKEPSK